MFSDGQKRPIWEHPWEYGLLDWPRSNPGLRAFTSTWWLNAKGVLQHADDVRAVFVDPHAIVLPDHIRAGVAHLFRDPVDRGHAGGEQLAGVGVAALARTTIANAGRFQVRFEEPVPHDEVTDVREAAFGVEEYKVQLVLTMCLLNKLLVLPTVH